MSENEKPSGMEGSDIRRLCLRQLESFCIRRSTNYSTFYPLLVGGINDFLGDFNHNSVYFCKQPQQKNDPDVKWLRIAGNKKAPVMGLGWHFELFKQ